MGGTATAAVVAQVDIDVGGEAVGGDQAHGASG
jgi:hypothetical protein